MSEMKNLEDLLGSVNAPMVKLTPEEYEQRKLDLYNQSEGNLNEVDGYNCDICHNKGFIARLDENGCEVYKECQCKKTRATLKRAKRSGLGDIITEYTFNKFEDTEGWQKQLKNTAQAFCSDDMANWFYIGGQVGCGKTHICTAIASYYIKAGKELRYMLWAEDSKMLKANVNEDIYQEKMNEYKNVDVLYIDDFLKVKQGEVPRSADINIAFEIINHRLLSNDKTTIISSEKQLGEIMDYDEATMSRIFQKTGCYKFSIAKDRNKNYRLKEKSNERK